MRTLNKIGDSLNNLGTHAEKGVEKSKSAFEKLQNVMQGPIAAARMIVDGMNKIGNATIGNAAKIEDFTAAFTPLTGSAANAKAMIAALNKEAATTPFELEGIAGVAKQLLPAFGNDVGKVTDTFRMLGDTAGGNIEKLDSITRGYMKSINKGKVDLESLNMISEAGVPIFNQLADSMGISVEQMYALSSSGKITSDDLTNAFKRMTSEGGIFFNGMNVSSQTFTGLTSTMTDNLKQAGAAVGVVFLPAAKEFVTAVGNIAGDFTKWATTSDNLKNALQSLGDVVVVAGIGVAGFLIAANGAAIVSALTKAVWALSAAFTAMGVASKAALSAAMTGMGPWVLGLTAAAAIIVEIIANLDKQKTKEKELAEARKTADEKAKAAREERAKIEASLSGDDLKKYQTSQRAIDTELAAIRKNGGELDSQHKSKLTSIATTAANRVMADPSNRATARKVAEETKKANDAENEAYAKILEDRAAAETGIAEKRAALNLTTMATTKKAQEESAALAEKKAADAKELEKQNLAFLESAQTEYDAKRNAARIKAENDAFLAEEKAVQDLTDLNTKANEQAAADDAAAAKKADDAAKAFSDQALAAEKTLAEYNAKWHTDSLAGKLEGIHEEEMAELEKAEKMGASEETIAAIRAKYQGEASKWQEEEDKKRLTPGAAV